jgi:hypothetical protein
MYVYKESFFFKNMNAEKSLSVPYFPDIEKSKNTEILVLINSTTVVLYVRPPHSPTVCWSFVKNQFILSNTLKQKVPTNFTINQLYGFA